MRFKGSLSPPQFCFLSLSPLLPPPSTAFAAAANAGRRQREAMLEAAHRLTHTQSGRQSGL